ncbi:hypothetical protein KCM76_22490 [Zooshikella marina]|uniref:DUF7173 family protein n=1 Tax=Zooshikella ganghwensis TaxID=202772 RepID=UPI001BB09E02|nr:hypothetical protein [Zooshikella ganghwensis]MBU2708779.1 hypothetical protein [Zooshikella ganghwensis]
MEEKELTLEALDYCASLLEEAREKETEAREHRISIEERIVELMGCEIEGTRSETTPRFKVRTTSKFDRKVDQTKVSHVKRLVGEETFNKVFRTKYEVDVKALRSLRDESQRKYAMVTNIITTTPSKTSVVVESVH